ncbi:lipid II:glycine glycyltransferase FemX [Treponema sp.]|uniref:lipid II:glycine glycyltransferase FemX n=1 Tax=Treponema sp. TaxID=166 RepID=UPI00298DD0D6|nr:peptidoglycan bridge formation glycyltransferase FemA/FemB family protein [Treponema sp.]MCR5612804.1 peptidoglycan bridge formation glycyltransferase FemA/FemB family protein [Treponema sp.]
MSEITINQIDNSKHTNDGSFLQTPFWCSFKARHGWTYRRFLIEGNECGVLNRSFCKGLFSIAYIPLFPRFEKTESQLPEKLCQIAAALKPFLPKNTIAIKFDPDIIFDSPEERDTFNRAVIDASRKNHLNIRKSKVDIQPPDSTQVDLTADTEQIMERMHSKWRYNIRLSERKGVKIQKYTGNSLNLSEKVDKFYELTKETNARDGNSSHTKSYYADLLKYSAEQIADRKDCPVITLYIAEHEDDEIASIMTLFSHDEAIYLYGASSNKKRNLMPNHLLQWTAMQDAKAYGSKYYDMYGMPPEGKNENHPMHGLYMFKANFGGKNIHRAGTYDVPLKKFTYKLFNLAEKLRAFWHKVVLKKIRGR